MAGSIIELEVGPGAYGNDATALLMTIGRPAHRLGHGDMPETDTALVVAKGQEVDSRCSRPIRARCRGRDVLFVSDVLEPDTRRTKVRIAFANPAERGCGPACLPT